jgi:hypothetical protein
MNTAKLSPIDEEKFDEYIEALTAYPKIQKLISNEFGTLALKEFLDSLLADTRDHTRQGFPPTESESLLKLSLLNVNYIEKMTGKDFSEDTSFGSSLNKWTLPRNF